MRWFLRRFLTETDARSAESELDELYEAHRRRDGDRAANRWRRRQRRQWMWHLIADRLRRRGSETPVDGSVGRSGLRELGADIRYSIRSLARTPGLSATIVLTVGLGLGATTAMVAVVRAVLVDPLPYRESGNLVYIAYAPPERWPLSVADYRALQEQQTSFEQVAGFHRGQAIVALDGTTERVQTRHTTWSYFSLFGLTPLHGRVFDKSDDVEGARVVVLSHAYWTRQFHGDPTVVGRAIRVNGVDSRVVGVLQPATGPFEQDIALYEIAVWPKPPRRGPFFIGAAGRLRAGVSRAAATEEMRAIIGRAFPRRGSAQNTGPTWAAQDLKTRIVGSAGDTLWFVLAGVACVLLIACANGANLLIARALFRRRELGIRAALGASQRRLLQHMLTESAILAVLAAALGTVVAISALNLVRHYGAGYIPRVAEIGVNGTVSIWLAVLAVGSAIVMGLVPALQSMRVPVDESLRSGGRAGGQSPASRRVRRALVAVEFALATPLLVAALLIITSVSRLLQVPVGIDTQNVLTAAIDLPPAQYTDAGRAGAFWDRARERLAALPGVERVAYADSRPPSDIFQSNNFDLEDQPTPTDRTQPECPWVGVTEGYFSTVGLPIQRGRDLTDRDFLSDAPPVVVVDRAWAERFFAGREVLGRRFHEGGCSTCPWTTVVGVVGTVKYLGLERPDQGTVYWPMMPSALSRYFVIRTAAGAPSPAASLAPVIREIDPGLAVSQVAVIGDLVDRASEMPRYLSVVLSAFGVTALVLSLVGIYGVMSHFVQQHARDIGIRLALGGSPGDVRRLVIGRGLRPAIAGVAAGLGAALLLTRLMTSLLFDVQPNDPRTVVIVTVLLMTAALAACLIPARRAAAVDPVGLLRDA